MAETHLYLLLWSLPGMLLNPVKLTGGRASRPDTRR